MVDFASVKAVFFRWRVLMLLFFLFASLLMIQPSFFSEGVAIRSIEKESPAALAGMHSPYAKDKPMFREVITALNGQTITSLDDYAHIVSSLQEGDLVRVETQSRYSYEGTRKLHLLRQEKLYSLYYNETTGL